MTSRSCSLKYPLIVLVFITAAALFGYYTRSSSFGFKNDNFEKSFTKLSESRLFTEIKKLQNKVTDFYTEFRAWRTEAALTSNNKNIPNEVSEKVSYDQSQTGLIMFTTWIDSQEKSLVHKNVINIWKKWRPFIKPLHFFSDKSTADHVKEAGWLTLPVSERACGDSKIPTIGGMFLDAFKNYDSPLVGYANGDIVFDDGLPKAIKHVLGLKIIREKPVMILVRRSNVDFSHGPLLNEKSDISSIYSKGRPMTDGSSDGIFTNRLFPWKHIPKVVVGRIGIAMWLVSYARAMNSTIIDITKTVKAIHMTTKSGNMESHSKKDSRCNHKTYNDLDIRPNSWGCGFIHCATVDVVYDSRGNVMSKPKNPTHKRCANCSINLTQLLPKSMGINNIIQFGPKKFIPTK